MGVLCSELDDLIYPLIPGDEIYEAHDYCPMPVICDLTHNTE
jgi:hypothetical protein